MKRFLMLVGVAVVAAAMYVAASPASQQSKGVSPKEFNVLKKEVASTNKTVKALKTLATAEAKLLTDCVKIAIPVDQFGDGQNQTEGYDYIQGPVKTPTTEFLTTALDVADSTDTGAVWFVGGQAACGKDLGVPALQHAAARAGIRLPHATTHSFSFIPRQR